MSPTSGSSPSRRTFISNSVAPGPRLTGGIAASVLLHGVWIAAFLLLRPTAPPPMPPVYSVHILAAPPGERAAGAVLDRSQVPPAERPTSAPVPTTAMKPVSRVSQRRATKTRPTPKLSTPVPGKTVGRPVKAVPPAPTAGGGPIGGQGADVANVQTPGIEFDFPPYSNNIVSQLVRRFGPMPGSLAATVRFVIRRDGSVDLESIKIVSPSRNYEFDQRAVGAVESAANARAFGPLPAAFREDILPVTFRFSPSVIR